MSATAAAVVDGIATLRAQDKIAAVERGAAQAGNLILLLSQEFLDVPTVVRISRLREAVWTEVSKDDIWGEYLVTVEGGSTQAINPQTRENQGVRVLNEIVPVLMTLGFDPVPATEQALRMMGLDPEALMIPAQQPAMGAGMEPPPGGAPEGAPPSGPTNGELMMDLGGPPLPAEMQAVGDIGL
jgi:hypothetical protein